MKILLIMNPGIPVPPVLYGGIERIVYLLAEEYHRQGHEVTLLARQGSYCSGKTVIFDPGKNDILFAWRFLLTNYKQFDLIHNFGRLIYYLPIVRKPVNKLMSYQRAVTVKGLKWITSLAPKQLTFTGCSNYCVGTAKAVGTWKTVYNAIDFSQYRLNNEYDANAPLMFLGRLDKIKGLHTAITVAKASNSVLWIGGNLPTTPDNLAYYKETIAPQIDNKQIIYLGELNDHQKNNYLGKARALLFPIEWDEPFGIVMIEAMACGTPVIGFNRGAVPEVIDEQVSGYIVTSADEMVKAISKLDTIDRAACRKIAETRFNIQKTASRYLEIFSNENGQ